MGGSRRENRSAGLVFIVIFVAVMLLFSGFCWKLWHDRDRGAVTRVFGYELMTVQDNGMEPEFPKGSLLFLHEAAPQSLVSGDAVICGRGNGAEGALCRIVSITEQDGRASALVSQDRKPESWEIPLQEIGFRAAGSIPVLGTFRDFLMTGKGLLVSIVAPCLLFFLIELFVLIRYMRSAPRRLAESGPDLRAKLSSHDADDQRENFVDVTAEFTGRSRTVPYQSPLRREMKSDTFRGAPNNGEPDEEVSLDSLSDKYSELDFNPIVRQPAASDLERVIIPDASPEPPVLRLMLDGEEAAQLPLSGSRQICVKTDGYRIDIIVAPDR